MLLINLEEEILQQQRKIHADSYPQSIWEIVNMYINDELIINPDFQRFFRWDKEKKSKLIESIFLGLPLPAFFVSTNEKREWELVDWLQRISTILEFMWELKEDSITKISEDNIIYNWLSNEDSFKYLKALWWRKWSDLSDELKKEFKRYKLNFNILKVTTDKEVKYELFQRLNTWWAQLSNQEVRNCIMIMENKSFYDFIESISNNLDFKETIASLNDNETETQYDKELILRFFALRHYLDWEKIVSVWKFIENKMMIFMEKFDYEEEKEIFIKTFSLLKETYWEDVFKRYYSEDSRFKRKMLMPIFDILCLWVSNNFLKLNKDILSNIIMYLWSNDDIKTSIWIWPRNEAKLLYALTKAQKILDDKLLINE